MSKFTPKERKKIYQRALQGLLIGDLPESVILSHSQIESAGLCELIGLAAYDRYEHISPRNFPEFFLFQPTLEESKQEHNKDYAPVFWWQSEDRKVRQVCLLLCIEMTKDV